MILIVSVMHEVSLCQKRCTLIPEGVSVKFHLQEEKSVTRSIGSCEICWEPVHCLLMTYGMHTQISRFVREILQIRSLCYRNIHS